MKRGSVNTVGIALAVLSALGFSTLALWGKFAGRLGFDSSSLNVLRFGIAGLILLALGFGRRADRARIGRLLLLGVWYASNTWLYFQALARISAGVAAILVYLAPAFVIVIRWALGQHPGARQLQALGLVSAGLLVIVGLPGPQDANALGLTCGALAGAFYGAYLVFTERALPGVPPLQQTTFGALGTAATFTAFALLGGRLEPPPTASAWAIVAGIVVFPTLLALPTLYGSIARIGAARASILSSLEPVFAVVLAWVFLGEPLSVSSAVGGGLILSGAVLAQLRTRARSTIPEAVVGESI